MLDGLPQIYRGRRLDICVSIHCDLCREMAFSRDWPFIATSLRGWVSAAAFGRLAWVITHIEDFPFLDCYTPSHATPGHPGNPAPCSFGKPSPDPSAVLHGTLPHGALSICSIDANGAGSGSMARGQACAHDADGGGRRDFERQNLRRGRV